MAKILYFSVMKLIPAFLLLVFFMMPACFLHAQESSEVAQCMVEKARGLLGTPYVAGTLDRGPVESLVIWSDKFDCVTLVEYCLALALSEVRGGSLEEALTRLRYRNGVIDGYGSRLHYFSEWILQQQERGFLDNVTCEMNCTPYGKKIGFMSHNKAQYPRLTESGDLAKVLYGEGKINRASWDHIPANAIKKSETSIREGDIIAITTGKPGLDIVHTGMAVRVDGRIHLLHASSDHGKVEVTSRPLSEYIKRNPSQTGIMVLRCR